MRKAHVVYAFSTCETQLIVSCYHNLPTAKSAYILLAQEYKNFPRLGREFKEEIKDHDLEANKENIKPQANIKFDLKREIF